MSVTTCPPGGHSPISCAHCSSGTSAPIHHIGAAAASRAVLSDSTSSAFSERFPYRIEAVTLWPPYGSIIRSLDARAVVSPRPEALRPAPQLVHSILLHRHALGPPAKKRGFMG